VVRLFELSGQYLGFKGGLIYLRPVVGQGVLRGGFEITCYSPELGGLGV
jgi:hypothetical protein